MTKRILIFLLLVGVSLCLFPRISAQAKTDSVEIWVGYFGETYVHLQDVSESEMEGLECGEWTYSFLDNGSYTGYNLAYGVTVTSLLDYVGISTDDINIIYFTGNDGYSGEKGNHGLYNLFGVDHWYYPNLAQNWDQVNNEVTNISLAESDRYEVPAILAFQQSHTRDSGAFDYDKYKALMSDENALRIVFGQTKPTDVTASDSVYQVYRITVTLSGSPIKDSTWDDAKVGSSQALADLVQVDSGFSELDELIKSGLEITTDDPSVVRIDENNNLVAMGKGEARINIEYSEGENVLSGSILVRVTTDPEEGNGGEEDDDSPAPPTPTDTGGTDTGDTDAGDTDTGDTDTGDTDTDEPTLTPDKPQTGNGNGGNSGSGGNDDGGSNGSSDGSGSGSGTASTGSGTGGNTLSDTEGDSLGAGGADRIQAGIQAGEERVPLGGDAADIYDQALQYMEDQLGGMEEIPSADQIASFTENLRTFIKDLIEQAEESDEPLDMEAILQMVEEYIDELLEETGQEDMVEVLSEDEPSGEDESSNGVYLSVGNISGGDSGGSAAGSGSMSTGNTAGGSGGQVLEIEPMPLYYTVILIVALAALFVGGGAYRSLRFRREISGR